MVEDVRVQIQVVEGLGREHHGNIVPFVQQWHSLQQKAGNHRLPPTNQELWQLKQLCLVCSDPETKCSLLNRVYACNADCNRCRRPRLLLNLTTMSQSIEIPACFSVSPLPCPVELESILFLSGRFHKQSCNR